MKLIVKISDIIDSISKVIIVILLITISVVVFTQVIMRYFFNSGISWSEELCRYSLIWMGMIGTTVAYKKGPLISITALEEMLPGNYRKFLKWFQTFLSFVFFIVFLGISFIALQYAKLSTSPNMLIRMDYIYSVFPITAIIVLIHIFAGIYMQLNKEVNE